MPERQQCSNPEDVMRLAIDAAARGIGFVEPNPAVGAVLVDDTLTVLAVGWHHRFGEAHAEVDCLHDFQRRFPSESDRRELLERATLYVTLEPCCHFGKTPPCSTAVIKAGIRRVVIGVRDPSPHVDGGGLRQLGEAGVDVTVGMLESEVRRLNAPFLKRLSTGLPWVMAKWAMTLDGRIATRTGASQWISCEGSRALVHEIRGRVDAVIVGAGTVMADDPLLTARPAGPRVATRIVVDSKASISPTSQLVRTAREIPVIVAIGGSAPDENVERLEAAGVEVLRLPSQAGQAVTADVADRPSLRALLAELGRRSMTNVLVEGGGELLGSLFDDELVDEAHVFVAPKFAGGRDAIPAVGGRGLDAIPQFTQLDPIEIRQIESDVYINGMIRRVR